MTEPTPVPDELVRMLSGGILDQEQARIFLTSLFAELKTLGWLSPAEAAALRALPDAVQDLADRASAAVPLAADPFSATAMRQLAEAIAVVADLGRQVARGDG